MQWTVVKKSPIHGKGLFAIKTIPEGTVLGTCESRATKEDNAYTLWISERKKVDVTCRFKYINHSDEPNVVYYDDLSVVALRTIKRGEELTHCY